MKSQPFIKLDDAVNVAINFMKSQFSDACHGSFADMYKDLLTQDMEQKCYLSNTKEYDIGYFDALEAVHHFIEKEAKE